MVDKSNNGGKLEQNFIPALGYDFLTPAYDFLCSIGGLGNSYHDILVNVAGNLKNKKVLDGGCATAKITVLMKKKNPGSKIYAIDADPKILKIARKDSKNSGIFFKQAFMQNLPFDNKSFDVVYSSLVIHHIPGRDKLKAFKEVNRVLKKDGFFLLSDFGKPRNFLEAIMPWFAAKFEHGTENYEGKIPGILSKAGFKRVELVKRYNHGIQIIKAYK